MSKIYSGMIGGTFIYRNNEYTIKAIDDEGDEVKITTVTGKTMRVSAMELQTQFAPVSRNGKALMLFEKMNTDLRTTSLITTLSETLEKLKTDPNYIPQAQAINETAKTMIELGKLQVEIAKTAKGI